MTQSVSQEQAAEMLKKSGGEDLKHCLTCDTCVETCFEKDVFPDINPRDITRGVLEGKIEPLADSEFIWACTLCSRCVVDCPKKIHMDVIVRMLRDVSRQRGHGPKRLEEGLQKIKEIGNSVGVSSEEFVENIEWLGEEAVADIEGVDEDEFSVPIDAEGADYLYIPNPREFTSAPKMFSVYLKFFLTVGAKWTFASNLCDISNWAYYMGDDETNLLLNKRIVDTARGLGVKAIVSTECGHGFKVLKKDAPEIIGEPLGFEVVSIVELAYKYWKEGKLKLRKGAIEEKVTYHDPCNVGRKLGIYDEPRELLKYIAKDYVEMDPYGDYSVCCGGGGSVAQNTDMGQKRLALGKAKSEQILATGAKLVTTSCQMCLAQLIDIQDHYKLPVETRTLMELLMDSLDE
jgi:Fe-S oxidoreductase